MTIDNIYFIPHTASAPCRLAARFCYFCVAIGVIALFITGIAKTDAVYVTISVCLILGITICGCLISKCYDRYQERQFLSITYNENQYNSIRS